ncbi:MAG: acyl-ACP--UDP-N-acetylglucosamine O-acyltransferase [Pirellulales bacterium]|nr:acyl-ACP--UDP-N-acetylglucosamine O-acyltransferase [Planctomycetales bacterium]
MPIHPSAHIDPRADVHPSASIGAGVVIDGPVCIEADAVLAPHAVAMGDTRIGARTHLHSHAVVGDVPQDRSFEDEPSRCEIGADCIIREGVTVHRATGRDKVTRIGDRCFLMTNSHVGHNCQLGNGVTLVTGAILGGHVEVRDRAILSGNVAVHQFVRIGELAMIAGLASVAQDIPPFMLTDRFGSVIGVNTIGMRRAGFTPEQRADVKQAYQLLYRSGLRLAEAVARLEVRASSDVVGTVLSFLSDPSSRGITALPKVVVRRAG